MSSLMDDHSRKSLAWSRSVWIKQTVQFHQLDHLTAATQASIETSSSPHARLRKSSIINDEGKSIHDHVRIHVTEDPFLERISPQVIP